VAKDIENKDKLESLRIRNPQRHHFFKRWLTLPEGAHYTAQAESTLKKAIYRGDLPIVQRGVRSKIILDAVDLDEWMLADKGPHKGPVDERPRAKNGRFK